MTNDQTHPLPQWPTPQPPTKSKGMPVWAVLGIIFGALFLLCGGIGAIATAGSGEQPRQVADEQPLTATTAPAASKKPAAPVYKIGTPFRAGDFQFTVHSKKCGMSEVGGPYLKTKAQGSFCRLDVTAKNVTSRPHMFDADSTIKVKDTQGRIFSADSEAGIYGNDQAAGWLDEINPGNKVRAFVFFDVAGGVRLTSATFSAGVLTTAEDITIRF